MVSQIFLVDHFFFSFMITVVGVERRPRGNKSRQLNCSPPTCINMFQAGWDNDPV